MRGWVGYLFFRFDVWFANRRANKYSSRQLGASVHSDSFWDHCIDQTALQDIPQLVQYVLDITEHSRLIYLGFSQGTAEGLAAVALKHGLNNRIAALVCLAPLARPKIIPNQLVQNLIHTSPSLLFLLFGRREFLSVTDFWREVLSPAAYVRLLDFAMWWLLGWRNENIDPSDKTVLYPHLYSYTSTKMIVHWFQVMRRSRFQMFDEDSGLGGVGHIPPSIPIAQIRTPIILFSGGADTLADENYIMERCHSNILEHHHIPHYGHLDFLWARDLKEVFLPLLHKSLHRCCNKRP